MKKRVFVRMELESWKVCKQIKSFAGSPLKGMARLIITLNIMMSGKFETLDKLWNVGMFIDWPLGQKD